VIKLGIVPVIGGVANAAVMGQPKLGVGRVIAAYEIAGVAVIAGRRRACEHVVYVA